MSDFLESRLEKIVLEAQREFQTPAISLAILRGGEIIFEAGYGTRTLGAEETVDADTSYAIASMSKSMTAAILAGLVEQGAISWDDRVSDYLPDFRLQDGTASREFRVRDLLIHNSGLRSEAGGTIWYGSDRTRLEVVRRLRFLRPVSDFRERFAYQNVTFLVAGLVAEAVSGERWDDLIQRRIFDPLGMTRSFPTLSARDASAIGNIASPHALIQGQTSVIPYRGHDNIAPAASVHSTAHDLARYLAMFLNRGMAGEKRILSEASVAELHRSHMVGRDLVPVAHPRLKPAFATYGYGWFIDSYGGEKRVYHSGGVDGMRGQIALFPERGSGVVVLSNSENQYAYQSVLMTIEDWLIGAEPVDWVRTYSEFARTNPDRTELPERISGTAPLHALEAYCGTFCDSVAGEIVVSERAGNLRLEFVRTPAFRAELSHYHYDTFRLRWDDRYISDGLVTFVTGSAGRVDGLTLDQPRLLDVDFGELDPMIRRAAGA